VAKIRETKVCAELPNQIKAKQMYKNDREDTKNLLDEAEQNKRHIARIENKTEEMNLHKLHRQKLSDAKLL